MDGPTTVGRAGDEAAKLAVLATVPRSTVLVVGRDAASVVQTLRERDCLVSAAGTSREALDGPRGVDYDAVLAWRVLGENDDPARLLRDLRRLVAPAGRLVAVVPNVRHAARRLAETALPPHHERYLHEGGLRELFETAGYAVRERLPVLADFLSSSVHLPGVSDALLEDATSDPTAAVAEFVVVAAPLEPGEAASHEGAETLLEHLQAERNRLEIELRGKDEELEQGLRAEREALARELDQREEQLKEWIGASFDVERQDLLRQLELARQSRFLHLPRLRRGPQQ